MPMDGKGVRACCVKLMNHLKSRVAEMQTCIDTLDDLVLGGRGPMVSLKLMQVAKQSYGLISDMVTDEEREGMFFLKESAREPYVDPMTRSASKCVLSQEERKWSRNPIITNLEY